MERVQLRSPVDLLLRGPQGAVKLDMERAVTLARRAGADSLLVPYWEPATAGSESGRPVSRRLHVLLVLADRREIVWEDAEAVRRDESPPSGEALQEAQIRSAAGTLTRRFAADLRLAGERG
jgi:hypothetical protein